MAGLGDYLETVMGSPLFLGGAALASGEGFGGAMQGMKAGNQFREEARKRQQQEQMRTLAQQMANDPKSGINPTLAQLFTVQPELAGQYLIKQPDREAENRRINLLEAKDRRDEAMDPLRRRQVEAEIAERLSTGQRAREMQPWQILAIESQIEERKAKAKGEEQRLLTLRKIGIDPESAEGISFLANGKLPAAAYEKLEQDQRKTRSAPVIAEGLENLRKMTEKYDDPSFTNAVGPWQGATPDQTGLLTAPVANIARGIGEFNNWREGGKSTPNEVRNDIVGATEALAAAIKPLIRGPGEGVWTDADQARLVSIVGDLAQASTKQEYNRRLNAVRDRIKANFNLDIPFDALDPASKDRGAKPKTPSTVPQRTVPAPGSDLKKRYGLE